MNTILIVAYRFPPYAGVGGHRWAKLSKYLARLGHDVHVLTVDWSHRADAAREASSLVAGVSVHHLRPPALFGLRYPAGPMTVPRRFARLAVRRLIDPLVFWDDETQWWGPRLNAAIEDVARRFQPSIVIATGHPFQVIRHVATFKRRHPEVGFIADLRDPWFQHRESAMGHRRTAKVRQWATESLAEADAVVCVTEGLAREFRRLVNHQSVVVIPNGVDLDDVPPYDDECRWDLVHAGNVTNRRIVPAQQLLDALVRVAPDSRVLFVGAGLERLERYKADLPNLELRDIVPRREALAEVAASRFGLHLNAPQVPYLVSTKIYEYPAIGVPVLSVNYGGDSEDLVNSSGWGVSINLETDSVDAALCGALQQERVQLPLAGDCTHEGRALAYSSLIGTFKNGAERVSRLRPARKASKCGQDSVLLDRG